jgi:hypothetical protein
VSGRHPAFAQLADVGRPESLLPDRRLPPSSKEHIRDVLKLRTVVKKQGVMVAAYMESLRHVRTESFSELRHSCSDQSLKFKNAALNCLCAGFEHCARCCAPTIPRWYLYIFGTVRALDLGSSCNAIVSTKRKLYLRRKFFIIMPLTVVYDTLKVSLTQERSMNDES